MHVNNLLSQQKSNGNVFLYGIVTDEDRWVHLEIESQSLECYHPHFCQRKKIQE